MKASTKIFTCLCAFLSILTAFFIRDTIRDCRKKKERLTQPINIAEHVGRFERIGYDKYEGNYEGTDISNDFVLGLKLEGRDSVIRTKHIPSGFSRGDSVWVVKGYAFDVQPSENVVRRSFVLVRYCRSYSVSELVSLNKEKRVIEEQK